MPPKKSANAKNNAKKQNKNAPKKPAPPQPATPTSAVSKSPSDSMLDPPVDDITVAFSLGSKYSTITLLPTTMGQRGEIIANQDGDRCIPSMVSFLIDDASSSLVPCCGTSAKSQMLKYLNTTVLNFTHLIGLPSGDAKLAQRIASSMNVIDTDSKVPEYVLTTQDFDPLRYTSEQLTSFLIGELIASAEAYTNKKIGRVVMSYPMDFSIDQQLALLRAAESHVAVASFIPEPVAAVLAYEQYLYSSQRSGLDGLVLSLDIGASTTCMCLMNASNGVYTTIRHDSFHLGGNDLDLILATYFSSDFVKVHPNATAPLDALKSKLKLLNAAEDVRKLLSNSITSNCHVEALMDGTDYSCTLNRTRFESLCSKWKAQLRDSITAFFDAENGPAVDMDEIDYVMCMGGVLSTPFVRKLVASMFPRATMDLNDLIDPNQAVAFGTAIHGVQDPALHHAVPNSMKSRHVSAPHLRFPIGIEDGNGHFVSILPRMSPVPAIRTVSIPFDKSVNSALIRVAEGRELYPAPDDSDDDEDDFPLYKGTPLGELALGSRNGQHKFKKVDLVFKVTGTAAPYKLHVTATAADVKSGENVSASLEL